MRSFNQPKLPVNANWWRNDEQIKTKGKTFVHAELPENLTGNVTTGVEMHEISKVSKDSTLDINDSKFLSPVYPSSSRKIYEETCEQLNCPSSSKFIKILDKIAIDAAPPNIDMAYYGLTDLGFRAIVLSDLAQFSSMNLQGNRISQKSFMYLVSMLRQSQITELNLSCMNLAKFGPIILSTWLPTSKFIKKLYLRSNNFDDNDGNILFEAVANNRSLDMLDLAENKLSTFCGNSIRKMLEENDSIESLDLSWNHLRLDGAYSLSKALKKNNGLKSLILNWNGFEDLGVKELALSIQDNEYLEELEIVCNRVTDIGFGYILKALEKNTTLKVLKIGWNAITQNAAEKGLESLKRGNAKGCNLKLLDFTNIFFRQNFKVIVDTTTEVRNDFTCVYGYEDSYGKRKMESYDPIAEALHCLKIHLEKHRTNLVELFEKFDLNGRMSVTYDDFKEGLKGAGIPINDTQIKHLIQYLDADGDGEIDLSELVIGTETHGDKGQ